MVEVRRLDNATAVLLQTYISARLRPGKSSMYPVDALVQVLYGKDSTPPIPATMRKRRQRLREALMTFAEVTTWQVSWDESSRMATIHRVSREDMERWEKQYMADMLAEHRSALLEWTDNPVLLEGRDDDQPVDDEAP